MLSFLVGFTSNNPTASTTAYQPMVTNGSVTSWSLSQSADYAQPLPHALTLDRLRVVVKTAPGSTHTLQFTVVRNGSTTALTCTVSGTGTSAQDLSHSVSFAAGDTIGLQCVASASITSPAGIFWTARQSATGLTAVLGRSTANTGFFPIQGAVSSSVTTANAGVIIPTAGTFENLYINSAVSSSNTFAVAKNGTGQTLAVALSAASTGNDTSHTFSVSGGDRVSMDQTGTTGVATAWGVSFAPTTDGLSFIGSCDNGHNTSASSTEFYQPLGDGAGSWSTTETNNEVRLQACTITALYSQTTVSPGTSPKAYVFTMRQNGSSTSAAVTINDASSTPNDGNGRGGNITGQSVSVSDDDLVAIQCAPTSTPTALTAVNSILISVATPASNVLSGWFAAMLG